MAMEALELARWTRFAAKGGIGKCTAVEDCVAENPDDLMFLKGDEITVLMQLPEPAGVFLGYCEGVVGRFEGNNVHFHSRLKKPVMAKRSSVSSKSPTSASTSTSAANSPVPRTRVSIDERVAAALVLPPSSPDAVPGVTRAGSKPRSGSTGLGLGLAVGSTSRRSSAGQENGDGSSRGTSPAWSPSHRHGGSTTNLNPISTTPPFHTPTPPPHAAPSPLAQTVFSPSPAATVSSSSSHPPPAAPLRASYTSSRHTSALSSYSQTSEDDPRLLLAGDSTFDTSVDTIVMPPPGISVAAVTTTATATIIPAPTVVPPTAPVPTSTSASSTSSLYVSGSTPTMTLSASVSTPLPPPSIPAALPTPQTASSSSSTDLDTSTSTYFSQTARLSLSSDSDGEVGIGLSLLQDLANSDFDSSDDDDEGVPRATAGRKGSVKSTRRGSVRRGSGAGRTSLRGTNRASVVSEASAYSLGSEEGLGYADTETGHSTASLSRGPSLSVSPPTISVSRSRSASTASHTTHEELEADLTKTHAVFTHGRHLSVALEEDEAESPVLGRQRYNYHDAEREQDRLGKMMTFPPVAPLSPSRSRYTSSPPQDSRNGVGEEEETHMESFEFPTPPTHTTRISLSGRASLMGTSPPSTFASSPPSSFVRPSAFGTSPPNPNTLLTPPVSPTSPTAATSSQGGADDSRTRRPSTTSTTTSNSTTTSTASDNWDADIYDDYRYSRFSSGAKSLSSRVSVGSRVNGFVGTAGGEWPPERPSLDAGSVRQSVDSARAGGGGAGRTRSRSNTTASSTLSPVMGGVTPTFVGAATSNPAANLNPSSTSTSPSLTPTRTSVPPSVKQSNSPQLPLTNSPPVGPEAHRTGHRSTDSDSDGSVYSIQTSAKHDEGTTTFASNTSTKNTTTVASTNLPPRPAPLTLASSNHNSTTSTTSPPPSASQLPATSAQQSIRSPLLHTAWTSPVSSPGSTAQFQFASMPSGVAGGPGSVGSGSVSPPSTGGREVSGFFPAGLDALGKVMGQDKGLHVHVREQERLARKSSAAELHIQREGQIVIEDDEDEHVVSEASHEHEEEEGGSYEDVDSTIVSDLRVLHESPSIASSPEPELKGMLGGLGMGTLGVANRTPSPMREDEDEEDEDEEELEREKEQLRRQAASMSTTSVPSPVPAAPIPQQQVSPPTPTTSPPPLAPPTLSPPPVSTPSPTPAAASHLRPRPTLSEIRPSAERQSLFLPHPNAPKATPAALSPGPMYIIQTQPPAPAPPNVRLRGGAIQTMHMALMGQGPPSGPRGRGPTIYGISTADLSAAMGPVLMHFSVIPPPATAPPPGSVPAPSAPPAPLQSPTSSVPPPALVPPSRSMTMPPVQPPVVAPVPRIAVRRVGSVSNLDVPSAGTLGTEVDRPGSGTGGVIPRANFFPKAGGARPRSRSFSGFQNTTAEVPLPVQRGGDSDDTSGQIPSATEVQRSLSPIVGSPTTPNANSTSKKSPKLSPLRAASPLSQNGASTRTFRPPNSPLGQSFAAPFKQTSASVPSSPTTTSPPRLRQTASRSTLSEAPVSHPVARTRTTVDGVSAPSTPAQVIPELRGRPSVEGDAISVHSSRSNATSPPPPPVGRQNSLRSKLSLPNLRRKPSRQDESSNVSPMSPAAEADLLQVQDMDFELVRPTLGHFPGSRASEDSGVMGRDMSVDARQDGGFLRSDSPALSLNGPRSPTVISDGSSSPWQPLKSSGRGGTDSEASSASMMDAHRQRELKWMAVIGSVQPAQSRKSKKVKKLIFDGVPSSVRYLVWSMLTDGKARCVPGVYSQLGGRGRVAALGDVERDVKRCFADHPQLQNTQGPVLSLLQAYLTMVPDVKYVTGLTLITGHLLLLAPEEDAFWIFVSVMDTHIRPYFSSTSIQVDVDSTLFGRAMDNVDPTTAKKLFGDFGLSPSSICRPWFTSLFVGCLPADYLNRVWDIFLFEGVPFLYRVALVLVACCRRQIFDAPSADAALSVILRPAPETLPSSPEALITLALAVKLKDEDLKKQRVKLEAQVKRQTQTRFVSSPGAISLPRT